MSTTDERQERARIEALDVALDRELAMVVSMSTADEQRLRDALGALHDAVSFAESAAHDLAGPGARKDAREAYEEAMRCIAALAQQAPTPAKPYGQVTTHSQTGQQCFYRWPESPYLDNASECVTVYATPAAVSEPAAPVDARPLSDETLDEIADLAAHWKRHRDNGRKPAGIRGALHMVINGTAAILARGLVSEPAAPVDARDALLQRWLDFNTKAAGLTPEIVYSKDRFMAFGADIDARKDALVAETRAAIARQAAAPAEGEKT